MQYNVLSKNNLYIFMSTESSFIRNRNIIPDKKNI